MTTCEDKVRAVLVATDSEILAASIDPDGEAAEVKALIDAALAEPAMGGSEMPVSHSDGSAQQDPSPPENTEGGEETSCAVNHHKYVGKRPYCHARLPGISRPLAGSMGGEEIRSEPSLHLLRTAGSDPHSDSEGGGL